MPKLLSNKAKPFHQGFAFEKYIRKIMRNFSYIFLLLLFIFTLSSCGGEDRSGEQPMMPKVKTLSADVVDDSCEVIGVVEESLNSRVVRRGITYGNDTLRAESLATDTLDTFHSSTRQLLPGTYYVAAFAENGMGTSYGDTIYFTIR